MSSSPHPLFGIAQPALTDPDEDDRTLHRRLCDGDPVAPSDLCCRFLGPLVAWLTGQHRDCDEHLIQEAAEDALINLSKNPESYDPARCSLAWYLRMAATADLRNASAKEQRHHRHRKAWSSVEHDLDGRNSSGEADDPASLVERAEEQDAILARLKACSADWPEQDRQVLLLMAQGERRTEVYAGVLGLTDQPLATQRREVKRRKDRLGKRAKRKGA
jgi:hypothetical protein